MPVFVTYHVPVLVEVDQARVISVRVDDESISGPDGAIDSERPSIDQSEVASEIQTAESAVWQAWQIGV